jgi:hypothetical protein
MKTRQLNMRVSDEELDRWKQAAGSLPLATWVRQTLDAAGAPVPKSPKAPSRPRPEPDGFTRRPKQYRTDF